MRAWWQHEPEGDSVELPYFYHGWFIKSITKLQSHTGNAVYRKTYSGIIENANGFLDTLSKNGGKILYKTLKINNTLNDCFIAWDTTLVSLASNSNIYYINIVSMDIELLERILSIAKKYMSTDINKSSIYSLSYNNKTLELTPVEIASIEIHTEYYTPEVIKDMKHVFEDLNKPDPCGKYVILSGPTGTGKTSLIKNLVKTLDASFILVQPQLTTEWTSSDIINILNQKKSELKNTIVFILENADECLTNSKQENNTLNILLNLIDGILSGFFDIRLIITSNIDQSESNELAKARLCRYVDVGLLDKTQANNIYKKLSGKDEEIFNERVPLSEVFKFIKDPDRLEKFKKLGKIGFTP